MAEGIWKLRLSMAGTLALIIGVSTLGFTLILSLMGGLNLTSLVLFVALFNLGQWLLAPYLVNSLYGAKRLSEEENPDLYYAVEELSQRSGMRTPKLMLSSLPIPNAFAYGSPLTGNHVAVTKGLLEELSPEQVRAVVGHELGHIRHRDMQVMMIVSFLPSLFYILARSLFFSGYYGGRDRRDSGGLALIGGASMLIYFFLMLFNLNLSRLREYYADRHSVSVVGDGRRHLSEALARISQGTWRTQRQNNRSLGLSSFKTLFIADPDRAAQDVADLYEVRFGTPDERLVDEIISRRLTAFDRFAELFSTHPNMVKRLRAIKAGY